MKFTKNILVKIIDELIKKITCLKGCLERTKLRDNREKNSTLRTIFINGNRPNGFIDDEPFEYVNNELITSKYTIWNFIPKNLFEQFRRVANAYYLITSIVLFMIPDPPTSPYLNIIPLIVVVIVIFIKEAYEDIKRHRSDYFVNSKKTRVLRENHFEVIKWQDIKCGDIVEVNCDSEVPCDMVLLYSTSESSTCHVQTSELDGETNLKVKYVPHRFSHITNVIELFDLEGSISCEKPNTRLYEFKGTISTDNSKYPITNENILLRGTKLKIAPKIYGCAVYTGNDTKMRRNFVFRSSNKRSSIEKKFNIYMLFFLGVLIILSLVSLFGSLFYEDLYDTHWYLSKPAIFKLNIDLYRFIVFIFYLNLIYLIPLELYVTLEIVRLIGSKFFELDIEMYDEKTDQESKVNNSDLAEELGQIEYLFTDKTGTLTENKMIFKRFCLEGKIYEEINGDVFEVGSNEETEIETEKLVRFFELLSLCHTVQVDNKSTERYNASSPDELSFILFCNKIGVEFKGDTITKDDNQIIRSILYNYHDEFIQKEYELLHVLEFDSVRKRMSVIVRDCQTDQITLFCKGADVAIFENSVCNTQSKYAACLRSFSENGWRTLALAYKILTYEEFDYYDKLIFEANNDISKRQERLAEVFEIIEKDLNIIGVTAVEDKLQDDVEDTLVALKKAGIKIWVLTGDKLETAVNISDSCKHFTSDMKKIYMANIKSQNEIEEFFNVAEKEIELDIKESHALIVDGISMASVLEFKFPIRFRNLALNCDAVLCCRMTPGQIVKLINESPSRPITAAIGDGANDVSMIQEANVGIGIFGKEGRNAARSANFAFAKFKFLKRALLVHGYLYYTRNSLVVSYFFYKNLSFALIQFYYGFFSCFSSTSLYNSLYLISYDTLFTLFPIFFFGLFEQQTKIKNLVQNPFYYKTITKNKLLSITAFSKWIIFAIWHSVIAFFFPLAIQAVNPVYYSDGKVGDFYQLGTKAMVSLFFINHIKILLIWHRLDFSTLFSFILSFIFVLLLCIIPNSIIIPNALTSFTDDQSMFNIYYVLFTSGYFWFCLILSVATAILPDFVVKIVENFKVKQAISEISEEYTRDSDYRRKKERAKMPKGLRYIKLPRFKSGTIITRSNGRAYRNKSYLKQYLRQFSRSTFDIKENTNTSNQTNVHSFASTNNYLGVSGHSQSLAETSFIVATNNESSYLKFKNSEPKLKSNKSTN